MIQKKSQFERTTLIIGVQIQRRNGRDIVFKSIAVIKIQTFKALFSKLAPNTFIMGEAVQILLGVSSIRNFVKI